MVDPGATTTLTRAADDRVPVTRPSTRLRNIELGLLLLALAVAASSILLVQLGALGHLDPHIATLAAGLAALVLDSVRRAPLTEDALALLQLWRGRAAPRR